MTWKEVLYTSSLEKHTPPEIIQHAEQFPGLLELNLAPLLNRYNYNKKQVEVSSDWGTIVMNVNFYSTRRCRKLKFSISAEIAHSPIIVSLTKDYDGNGIFAIMEIGEYLSGESKGTVTYRNFNLENYTGTFAERVNQFCEFFLQQLEVRGRDFISGGKWSNDYTAGIY